MLYARISTLLIAGVFCVLFARSVYADEGVSTTTEEVSPSADEPTTERSATETQPLQASLFSEPSLDPTTFYTQIFFPNHTNRFAGLNVRQTAGKDGDRMYLGPIIDHAATTVSVLVDFSKIFGDANVSLEDVFDYHDSDTSNNLLRQFQGGPYTVASGGFNGIVSVLMTATDEFGAIAQETFDVLLDHTTPTLSFTSITRSSTERLKDTDTLLLSGTLDGTGSGARIYTIQEQELSAEETMLGRYTYSSILSTAPELYALRGGLFTDIPLRARTSSGLAEFPQDATSLRFVFTIEDEAGNLAYATTTIALTPTTEPPPPTAPSVSNVLFLPGIKGSRLFSDEAPCDSGPCTRTLWEPYGDGLAQNLLLDSDGKTIHDVYVQEGNIIDEVAGEKFYSSFIDDMDARAASDEYGPSWQWRAAAYDWRLSLPDIVNHGAKFGNKIYYDQATSTPYIEQTLRELAAKSATGKVTIIAHSNGGLVTKSLLQKIGDAETAALVDKIIFVGVPQTGAPQTLGALLIGYGESLPGKFYIPDVLISKQLSRQLAENSPMAYHLMPSARYIADVQDPNHSIIGFSGSHLYQTEQAAYGSTIDTIGELDDFLVAREGGREKPAYSDLTVANILNPNLLSYANTTHASLDAWVPPSTVQLYQIAGWGMPTVSGVDFYDERKIFGVTIGYKRQYRPVFVDDGDGVVPVPSALMTAAAPNVHSYWLNLFVAKKNHGDMFESVDLEEFLHGLISDSGGLPTNLSSSPPGSGSMAKRLIFQLHSPLTLGVYDPDGNYTGLNKDGSVSEEVSGATYGEFGDVKYIIAPAGVEYELVMNGQDSGTFSLDIQEQLGDYATTTTISNVPTTSSTAARLSITNGITDASALSVDSDGDGVSEIEIAPVVGETVTYSPSEADSEEPVAAASSGSSSRSSIASGTVTQATTLPVLLLPKATPPETPSTNPRVLGADMMVADESSSESRRPSTADYSQTASVYSAFSSIAQWLKTVMYNIWYAVTSIIDSLL